MLSFNCGYLIPLTARATSEKPEQWITGLMSPCDLFEVVSVDIVMNLLDGIKENADRFIMVERVDNESAVFCHINKTVPFSFKKSRGIVDKIRGKNFIEKTVFVRFVKSLKSGGEKTEGRENKNALSVKIFQLTAYVKHAVAA